MKIQNKILAALLAGILGTGLLSGAEMIKLKKENQEIQQRLDREIQQGIANEVFRLHVIANSDLEADQELKLEVKNGVVAYLKEILGENTTLEETKEAVLTHLPEIEERAQEIVTAQGSEDTVCASVERTYFPDKTYGDCTFPAGEYEALQVRIGEAQGKNWWCVLYPSLCFLEDTYGIVTEEKKEDLKSVLTEEEFEELLQNPEKKGRIRIGFRWFGSCIIEG